MSDNLPKEICQPCLHNLVVAYKFIVTFNEAQVLLKTLEQQILDAVKTDYSNNYESVVDQKNTLENSTVKVFNNGLMDHNYHSSQIQTETEHLREDDQKENISGITIMTIEDVLKDERKRRKTKIKEVNITKGTVQNGVKESEVKLKKKKVVKRSSNVRRKRSDRELEPYKCDICNLVYQSRAALARHKYSMHNANWMEVFKCSVCGVSCETRSSKL